MRGPYFLDMVEEPALGRDMARCYSLRSDLPCLDSSHQWTHLEDIDWVRLVGHEACRTDGDWARRPWPSENCSSAVDGIGQIVGLEVGGRVAVGAAASVVLQFLRFVVVVVASSSSGTRAMIRILASCRIQI